MQTEREYSGPLCVTYLHDVEKVRVYILLLPLAMFPFRSETKTQGRMLTQWMTAAQLRFLRVLGCQLIPDTVQ